MRIVSLLPSATEIAYALGLRDQLAGVTDECRLPTTPGTMPAVVVRSRQPEGLSAGEIDAWVSQAAAAGGLYRLDEEALAGIRPELVLTQDLCRVCAVPTGDVDAALDRLACPSRVVTLEPTRLGEVLETVRTVATAAGVAERGEALVGSLQARLDAVRRAVAGRPPVPTLVLEWLDPPYTAGHWVPDVVAAAGGEPLLAEPGGRSRAMTWDDVRTVRPERLVLAPCGTEPDRTWEQAHLVPRDVLDSVPAVAVDLACPAPGLVDCVEALAAVLHPDAGLSPRGDVLRPRPLQRAESFPTAVAAGRVGGS